MKNLFYFIAGVIVLAAAVVIVVGLIPPKEIPIASVTQGNEYNSTSTGALFPKISTATLKTGYGTLGSVIVTKTLSKDIIIYDATTTNVNLRVGATTSLPILAFLPISATVGTYVFDNIFYQGLLVVSDALFSANGSTTITWR
jgi:hypothetical protein